MEQEWTEALSRRVAAEIRRLREDMDKSAQWLSDATAELGYRISRSRISALETGRHPKVGIEEVIIIAAALRVPPVTLIFPDLPNGAVEVLPQQITSSWNATQWFSGERATVWEANATTPGRNDGVEVWAGRNRALRLLRKLRDARIREAQAIGIHEDFAQHWEPSQHPELVEAASTMYFEALKRRNEIEDQLIDEGYEVPLTDWPNPTKDERGQE